MICLDLAWEAPCEATGEEDMPAFPKKWFFYLACFLVSIQPCDADTARPLQLGVLPNVSPRLLVANYQPLRQHLEHHFQRLVDIVTAPDFATFLQRTQHGEYDMVVTAAHYACLAMSEAGYTPLVMYQPDIRGLLVTAQAHPLREPAALRGTVLALANPLSLVAVRSMQWLQEQGLQPEVDFRIVRAANEDSLGRMLLNGESRAAILSSGEFQQIPQESREQLAIFQVIAEVPGFIILAHPRWQAAEASRLQNSLLQFAASAVGKQFLAKMGFTALQAIAPEELQPFESLAAAARQQMESVKE